MVQRDLPEVRPPNEWQNAVANLAQAMNDTVALMTEIDNGLQQQIDALKSYNEYLFENVIKRYHPDASLTEMVAVMPGDELSTILGRRRSAITSLRENISKLKIEIDKMKKP